jgi:hypothetical protein
VIPPTFPGLRDLDASDDGDLNNGIDRIFGVLLPTVRGECDVMWDLVLSGSATGEVQLDLTLEGLSEYSHYADLSGNPYPGDWLALTEQDLGSLTIHVIPEPTTLALLGFGMLVLTCRRRQKT